MPEVTNQFSIFDRTMPAVPQPSVNENLDSVNQNNDDTAKSHSMVVQATAKDIISFEKICKLSHKYGIDNKLIYELHSEFISIRDMQKSKYEIDNLGIPAKLFVEY